MDTGRELVFGTTFVAYFVAAAILCSRGWIFSAGIATFLISLAPMTREIIVYPWSDAPGTAFFMLALLPLSLIMVLIGIARLIYRGFALLQRKSGEDRVLPVSR